ncbi:CRISPR-associated helicase Cas3' [Nocardiopsis sp. CNT312]|uniref:CRISPR-associated helicase Cas3' n=1 Tax=Nocardiopsis sp. CNT312 TaxID=1137268 RepID=UPI0021011445|nr:CRISPR-associated helicase Cas3' [Nocardiopsis sp. CNT312]
MSAPARSVWAKHDRRTDGWLPLWRHMADSAAVAGRLWDHWLPDQVRRRIADALQGGAGTARTLTVFLACTHDIGKATPAFACQVEQLADPMRRHGLDVPLEKRIRQDRKLAPHGLAGQLLIQEWLVERHGWAKRATLPFTIVAGGHHGVPPEAGAIEALRSHPHMLRTRGSEPEWKAVQYELLDHAAAATGAADHLAEWSGVKLPQPVQVLLTAVVIAADWIASNPDLFPLFPGDRQHDPDRAEHAWRLLDLPAPWRPRDPGPDTGDLFEARFDLPPGAKVRPVQEAAVTAARDLGGAGLLMVEAPMGEGKTEAALAAAEILAAHTGAGGCFFALPTMATGNAMFPRLLSWLERLPVPEGHTRHSVHLAHSKAALNRDFTRLMWSSGRSAHIDPDGGTDHWDHRADEVRTSAELVAHHWLRGRKKGMLASFAVGTIDQLLFVGLKTRHLALRHLAVAGKVVVVDEAHAYDTYMGRYLDRSLSWLGAYGVPVVVLSATLPARRRRALAEAYAGVRSSDADFAPLAQEDAYPLVTAVKRGGAPALYRPAASGRSTRVSLERLGDGLDALAERLSAELADGGNALVIRNTVARVHDTAERLRERFGHESVTVAHARFLDLDRAANDEDLLRRFGSPDEVAELDGGRPTGPHVVVASQVAEQSLDIDFDLLVTDLAPVDLMLQRMGRLHRHMRGSGQGDRPPRLRTARCIVTGADWSSGVPTPLSGAKIYGPYLLLRTAAVLEGRLAAADTGDAAASAVSLPDDISPLVQAVYGDAPLGPRGWHSAIDRQREGFEVSLAEQRHKAEGFLLGDVGRDGRSLVGWVAAGAGDADDTRAGRQQVRDTPDTIEVLVLQRRVDGTVATVPWLSEGRGGRELPTEAVPPDELARTVAACGLRLPFEFTFEQTAMKAIEELEDDVFPAWQAKECHWLAGELLLILDEECRRQLSGFLLHYSRSDGLKVSRAQ